MYSYEVRWTEPNGEMDSTAHDKAFDRPRWISRWLLANKELDNLGVVATNVVTGKRIAMSDDDWLAANAGEDCLRVSQFLIWSANPRVVVHSFTRPGWVDNYLLNGFTDDIQVQVVRGVAAADEWFTKQEWLVSGASAYFARAAQTALQFDLDQAALPGGSNGE